MYNDSPLFSISNKKFNIIILAAGLGTRLRPETDFIPKALVELGGLRAIDYSIRKYQYIAGRIIIGVGYSADLVTHYVTGKYPTLNLFFSHEEITSLRGPGTSLLYALDFASSRLPTLITFCDYIIGDQFSVEHDCLGLCSPSEHPAVLGEYKTTATVEEAVVVDIKPNHDIEHVRENGFTGHAICHDTILLKAITYGAASLKSHGEDVDYAFEIIREYIRRVKTLACPLSRILEFGTSKTLEETRKYVNGNHGLYRP